MNFELDVDLARPGGFRLQLQARCESHALAVVGPSGAGKSTLLAALAGALRARRGERLSLRLDGRERAGAALHARRVGWVRQDPLLFPHLNVRRNLLFARPEADPAEVIDALALAPLLERAPRHLSGGEQRRVALGRALLADPELLLLDEPFSGLDALGRRRALGLLRELRERFGVPLVLVSHVPEDVVGLCDHALRLEAGRLVDQGDAVAVLRAGETNVDNHFRAQVLDAHTVDYDGVRLHLALPPDARGELRVACSAHDILLARTAPQAVSARNVFATTVAALHSTGGGVLVELARPRLLVTLTHSAVDELQLAPGVELVALLKATALVVLGSASSAVRHADAAPVAAKP
ncbi:MAG: molybdenum import ATP-binding protein ModC [Planctomycetota bacterium]|nr:MAG: molybdenum import ATP-binding protein ModC [Planctomycetota bacterium]